MASPLEVEDFITSSLQRLAKEIPAEAAVSAQNAARAAAATLRRRLPKSARVLPSDEVSGWRQPSDWITVQTTTDGAEITIKTFYGDLRNATLRSALEMSGQSYRFPRPALQIHLRAPEGAKGPQKFVDFATAPRLKEWAKQHYQAERRSILVDQAGHILPYLAPVDEVARLSIFRDLTQKLGG